MPSRPWFAETVRLPRKVLVPFLMILTGFTLFLIVLWAIATMSDEERLWIGLGLLATFGFWFAGPLWFIAAHVEVDERGLRRRIGHRRVKVAFADIVDVWRTGPGLDGLDRISVFSRDGTEVVMSSRHPDALVAAIDRGRALR